ncbi:MAG: tetratricopeptide repeat protein, partial [Lentisphaerae bacterium]|nr:tetratricopeptide repeat protein [Lentisphaerota bacterium]
KGRIETWAMTPYRWIFLASGASVGTGDNAKRVPAIPPNLLANVFIPFEDPHSHRPIRKRRYFPNPYTALPDEPVGFMIDVKVPGSAAAGMYRGKATLVINGETRIDVPVELEVFDFFMPRRRTVATTFGDAGPGKNRAGDYDRWVKMMHRHRANGYGARVRPEVNVYAPSRATWGAETYEGAEWSHYDRIVTPYVDGSMFEDGVPMKKIGVTGWYAACSQIPEEVGFPGYTALGKEADNVRFQLEVDYLKDLRLHTMRMGFADRLWSYEVDEPGPNPNILCTLDTQFFHMKKAIPEMLCMVTSVNETPHVGLITAYNSNPSQLMAVRQFAKQRQALGEEYWLYNAYTYTADVRGHMNQRFVPWYAWRQKADSWLQWITNFGVSWDMWPEAGGDGDMTYVARAGHFGIRDLMWIGNMEMKLYREGMEDIEYLELAARAIGEEEVNKIIRKISFSDDHDDYPRHFKYMGRFKHYGGMNYEAIPSTLFQVRRELARVIEQHRPDDGHPRRPVAELLAEVRGLVEADRGREAMPLIKQALTLEPGNRDAGMAEVDGYERIDMREEALESALRLMRRHRADPVAWKRLGDVYAGMSRFDEAHECWRTALERQPADGLAREIRSAIADSSVEGATVLRQKLRPGALSGSGSTWDFEHIQEWHRWPGIDDKAGGNIWRGGGKWGGFGTMPHTRAGLTRKLLAMDIGGLPRGARVKRAWLECTIRQDGLATSASYHNYVVYPVLRPWFPQYLTMKDYDRGRPWAEKGCGRPGIDRGPIYSPAGMADLDWETGKFKIDITRIVRDWVDGKYPNHGLALVPQGSGAGNGKVTLKICYTQEKEQGS